MDKLTADFGKLAVSPVEDNRVCHNFPNCESESWIRRRLVDGKGPIVFVGESMDRSLPIALATMRGSWDDIWTGSRARYEVFTGKTLGDVLAGAGRRSRYNTILLHAQDQD
ncbi:hypothetical protein FB451DRAFT_118332, partial [Mycena latifolia]